MTEAAGVVVVFAKEPRPGRVKTRMVPPLSFEQAAGLYACLLEDALAATATAASELSLVPVLAVDPPAARGELARLAPPGFRVVAQRGADLSARMAWATAEAAAMGARRILLRGSDSPLLDVSVLADALRCLDAADLVVCPDRDGGYNLIGLREPVPGLFEHPMSTPSVLDDTLANAAKLGLCTNVRAPGFDLDRAADLALLAEARSRGEAGVCAKTLTYVDTHDLWCYGDGAMGPKRGSGRPCGG